MISITLNGIWLISVVLAILLVIALSIFISFKAGIAHRKKIAEST